MAVSPGARPGDLDAFDPAFLDRHGTWITALLSAYFRAEVDGLEHLPRTPFLGVGNHSGATLIPDTLLWLGHYHGTGRTPPLVTLAHDQMFDGYPKPLAHTLAKLGGVRAHRDVALDAFRRGYAVQVYPGGDFDACRPFTRRNEIVFAGRTGYVQLAREADVPIVPVVSAGAHETLLVLRSGARLAKWLGADRRFRLQTLPLTFSVPWGLWLGPLPGYLPLPAKIRLRVLPPIDAGADAGTLDDVDARVRASMQRALDEMNKERRFPWLA